MRRQSWEVSLCPCWLSRSIDSVWRGMNSARNPMLCTHFSNSVILSHTRLYSPNILRRSGNDFFVICWEGEHLLEYKGFRYYSTPQAIMKRPFWPFHDHTTVFDECPRMIASMMAIPSLLDSLKVSEHAGAIALLCINNHCRILAGRFGWALWPLQSSKCCHRSSLQDMQYFIPLV